jgi:hypothetical protein
MTCDDIVLLLHHDNSSLLSVCPCNTTNALDTKTHWWAKELHHIMGCRKFWNYKTILQVSLDEEWVNSSEFPPSLGLLAAISKAKRGLPLYRTKYCYFDAGHRDIAFGDFISVGCFRYALILMYPTTQYTRTFGLKSLNPNNILSALRLFRALVDSHACCFYCNCNANLFGTAILEYLINTDSKVVAAPAKRQSSNGLVKLHWKTMVHMAWAYLAEKQMPCNFWFNAISHAAWMVNAIPSIYKNRLALPFLLIHGIGHDENMCIPLFSCAIFIMKWTMMTPSQSIWHIPWTG